MAVVLSAAGATGLFDEDAAMATMVIAPAVMIPLSTLCRAGQDLRFGARCRGTDRQICAGVGQRVIDIPPGMTIAERVTWITARLAKLGSGPGKPGSGKDRTGD